MASIILPWDLVVPVAQDRENAWHPSKLNLQGCPEDRGNLRLSGAQILYGEDLS